MAAPGCVCRKTPGRRNAGRFFMRPRLPGIFLHELGLDKKWQGTWDLRRWRQNFGHCRAGGLQTGNWRSLRKRAYALRQIGCVKGWGFPELCWQTRRGFPRSWDGNIAAWMLLQRPGRVGRRPDIVAGRGKIRGTAQSWKAQSWQAWPRNCSPAENWPPISPARSTLWRTSLPRVNSWLKTAIFRFVPNGRRRTSIPGLTGCTGLFWNAKQKGP